MVDLCVNIFINDNSKNVKQIISFLLSCFTWNNLDSLIVKSYSFLIDIGTASGQGTCSRRDAYMSILPEELNKNHSHLMFR